MTQDSIRSMVEDFHARGGQVTVCPTRKVAKSTAELPHRWSKGGEKKSRLKQPLPEYDRDSYGSIDGYHI